MTQKTPIKDVDSLNSKIKDPIKEVDEIMKEINVEEINVEEKESQKTVPQLNVIPGDLLEKMDIEELQLIDDEKEDIKAVSTFLANYMFENNYEGLAAPQIGINKKIFVMKYEDKKGNPIFISCINPLYFPVGSRSVTVERSITYGIDKKFKTKRFKAISAKYWTIIKKEDGTEEFIRISNTLRKGHAIVYQHLTDILNNKPIRIIGKEIK